MAHSSPRLLRQRWQIAPTQAAKARQLAQVTQLPLLLAQVLINRGMDTPEMAQTFLEPEKQFLPSPLQEFPDLPIALDLLLRAIATHQPIAICGDYDADGMTSTALLLRSLRFLGAIVDYAIPSRMQEGYGINQRIVEDFHQDGVGLILTVDNGIAAFEPIARARELGLTVIVTDHHDLPETLPPANAILNPKLIHEDSPYRGVAGVGVAYILAICLAQCLQKTQDLTVPLIELFTLGTIADLAPLTGVNRRWVRRGLKLLPKSRIPGIQALIQVAGLASEKALKPEAIGFRLGPRINAIGRISDPQIVIELLTTDDEGRALELAMKCEEVNQLRQRLCELIEQEAIAWCEQSQINWQQERVLVVVQPDWHHGVIGIVASRLVERYGVPVFIGTYEDETQQQIRGSARGIPEFNVFEALQFCGEILERFGGHWAAGGFSLKAEHLGELRSRLSIYANHQLQLEHLKPLIKIDAQADFSELTLELYQQIDALHPCGIENPDPIFWTANVRVIEQRLIGRDQTHLKLTLAQAENQESSLRAIAWRWAEYYPLPDWVDIAYRLRLNEWNGNQSVELELVGVRPAEAIAASILPQTSPTPPSSEKTPPTKLADQPTLSFLLLKDKSPENSHPLSHFLVDELGESTNTKQTTSSHSAFNSKLNPEFNGNSDSNNIEIHPNRNPEIHENGNAEDTLTLALTVEFYYSARKYICDVYRISATGVTQELQIRNLEGQVLAVQPQQQRGFLGKLGEQARAIDISQPHYFNLIRTALDALEIAEKNQLILEKDQLITEKDQQIVALNQQIEQLQQKLSRSSQNQQQPEQNQQQPEQNQQQPEQNQQQPTIPQAELQLRKATLPKPEEIKRTLRDELTDPVWHCLSLQSQKDLVAVYKSLYAIQSEASMAQVVDYSEAGLRLAAIPEREIVQPFFKQIQSFLQTEAGRGEIGGISLKARKKYTLEMLVPLLASVWQSLRDEALTHSNPVSDEELYCSSLTQPGLTQQLSQSDRALIQACLQQWQHPIARWLLNPAAASAIAQIGQLRALAASRDRILYEWQFEKLRSLLMGDKTQPGIFQEIYEATL